MSVLYWAVFLLLIPLLALTWVRPFKRRLLNWLRIIVYVLILAALANISITVAERGGTVMVVVDRSHSMPADTVGMTEKLIHKLLAAKPEYGKVGVVGFGGGAIVEKLPDAPGFEKLSTFVDNPDASNLAGGIERALQSIEAGTPGRILVIADGKWSGQDPSGVFATSAARNIAVDYQHKFRHTEGDLAVAAFETPSKVAPGEFFHLSCQIVSPTSQKAVCRIRCNNGAWREQEVNLLPGDNFITWRDTAYNSGILNYTVEIVGSIAVVDEIPENNIAKQVVEVAGGKPILYLSSSPTGNLGELLQKNGFAIVRQTPSAQALTPESLAGYSGVILENVPSKFLGKSGLELLRDMIKSGSLGLMMTGGRQSFAVGGYFKSPLEEVLPVSMEQRQEMRKSALALMVALDRSGSMAMPVAGGTKMDMANQAAYEAYKLLMPMDEFGVIAVDSAAHVVLPLTAVDSIGSSINNVLRIESMGGGIFCYTALKATLDELYRSKAVTRHMILFADAADAEEPGQYVSLLNMAKAADITVSVVGLGTEQDCDADFLKDVAKVGGGECYFSDRADELPQIFVQDTFMVARNTFVDQPATGVYTGSASMVANRIVSGTQVELGGYNLCYSKPDANVLLVSADEFAAPLAAAGYANLGRVSVFTGEADGEYTGQFAVHPDSAKLLTALAGWMQTPENSGDDWLITQHMAHGALTVEIHLDPRRKADPWPNGLPQLHTVIAGKDGKNSTKTFAFSWENADLLQVSVPLHGGEIYLSTVAWAESRPVALAPVREIYSPEFIPTRQNDSMELKKLCAISGGIERLNADDIWQALPDNKRQENLSRYFLLAAILLFLLEVAVRRLNWFTKKLKNPLGLNKIKPLLRNKTPKRKISRPKTKSVPPPEAPSKTPPPSPPEAGDDLAEALRRVKRQK